MLVTSIWTWVDAFGVDLLFGQPRILQLESGVAEAVTKREQRRDIVEQIAAARRRLVVVENGQVADGAREADGELAAGIGVAEEDVGDGVAGLLAEVPALEDDRHVRDEVVDRERTPVEEESDDRLAERGHGFDQLILAADQVEAGAVAHVLQVPGFARGLLVAADGEHDDVGLLRHFDSFGDLSAIFCGIAGDDFVLIPGPPMVILQPSL